MHEIKLTENVVSILEKEIAGPEVGNVKNIYLEVGKLRYIVPGIMISCFEHIPKSEKLINAKINIKELPVKIKCMDCGAERIVEDGIYTCGECSSTRTELVSGDEFMLKGIEW